MEIITSESLLPKDHMERDTFLLDEARHALHFYSFSKLSATFGYFIRPDEHLTPLGLETLSLARRPTGGGLLFHAFDFTFSLIVPSSHPYFQLNTLDAYHAINTTVARAVKDVFAKEVLLSTQEKCGKVLFCMKRPTPFDLTLGGKKVGGAAERKTKKALLHQATLSLLPFDRTLISPFLIEGERLTFEMEQNSGCLIACEKEAKDARAALKKVLEIALM